MRLPRRRLCERMLRNICCAPWRPYPVSDGSSLASRLLGHGAFIFTSDGPVYRPPQLARGDGPSVPQRRRSQGHSAAAVIDGGRDDAACLPNMCVSGCLDGRGCATGIGATRHGQPSTLRWQAVCDHPMQTTVVWEVLARQQQDFADARKHLVETRFPKLGSNLVRSLPLPPLPSADSVAFGLSTGRSQRLQPSSKPCRSDTLQNCFRRHFEGSPSSVHAYGRQRTRLSAPSR